MEIYESKRVAELIEKMYDTKDIHELYELYNEAEKVLVDAYAVLFSRLVKTQYRRES